MGNNTKRTVASVINLRAILWDLLAQWKAILIVSIIMALLLSGLKYGKDMKAFKTAKNNKEAEEVHNNVSAEERIAAILESLSETDRSDVEFVEDSKDWIRTQRRHLNESILYNVNPVNQRTLQMEFQISAAGANKVSALTSGYLGYLYTDSVLESLGTVIDPDAEKRYIGELITYDLGRYVNIASDADNYILSFRIVIPEGKDASAVEQATVKCMEEGEKELSKTVGEHQLTLVSAEDYYRFNTEAVNNRSNIINNIYNIQNNLKNASNTQNDAVKAAISAIDAIKAEERAKASTAAAPAAPVVDEPQPPGFSKKYAALGFILGILMYAFVYLMKVIVKGNLTCASDLKYYTDNRILGELYYVSSATGINKLFHSSLVNKLRYGDKLSVDKQIKKSVSSIEAICQHNNIKSISLLCMPGADAKQESMVSDIKDAVEAIGISVDIIKLGKESTEKQLIEVENAILVTGRTSKAADVIDIVEMCKEYKLGLFGSIYSEAL